MIPKLLAGINHSQEHVERLRMDMRRDLAEEEGEGAIVLRNSREETGYLNGGCLNTH